MRRQLGPGRGHRALQVDEGAFVLEVVAQGADLVAEVLDRPRHLRGVVRQARPHRKEGALGGPVLLGFAGQRDDGLLPAGDGLGSHLRPPRRLDPQSLAVDRGHRSLQPLLLLDLAPPPLLAFSDDFRLVVERPGGSQLQGQRGLPRRGLHHHLVLLGDHALHPREQLLAGLDRRGLLLREPGQLPDPQQDGRALLPLLLGQLPGPTIEQFPVAEEALGSEQPAQQLAAVVAGGDEELLELALGEQDDLSELVGVQPHDVVQAPLDVPDLGFEHLPLAAAELLQLRGRLHEGGALAAALRPLVGRAAGDPVARVRDGELQADLAGLVGAEEVGTDADLRTALVARHRAEQRVADRVEDGGLACPGASGDQEDPVAAEGVEIHPLGAAEGPETGDGDVVDPHARTFRLVYSATTSVMSSASSPVAPSPLRTLVRKPSISSWSLRPRTSSA